MTGNRLTLRNRAMRQHCILSHPDSKSNLSLLSATEFHRLNPVKTGVADFYRRSGIVISHDNSPCPEDTSTNFVVQNYAH